jgi:DNA-binding response OmpR family regulator
VALDRGPFARHQRRLDAGVSLMQKPFSQNVLAMRVRTMLEEA